MVIEPKRLGLGFWDQAHRSTLQIRTTQTVAGLSAWQRGQAVPVLPIQVDDICVI